MSVVAMLCGTTPVSAQVDLAGEWAPMVLEDWFHRVPGATLGDYTGIPINQAARQKAEAWDASVLSQPERQAQPHPAQYSFRGPGPRLRIEQILEPVTDRVIGYKTSGTFGRPTGRSGSTAGRTRRKTRSTSGTGSRLASGRTTCWWSPPRI